MKDLDEILDGFTSALELERELGVRTVEMDRALLKTPASVTRPVPEIADATGRIPCEETPCEKAPPLPSPSSPQADFVFLHHRRLTEEGNAMMAKILVAMKRTAEESPIVIHPPAPPAKAYVVLGSFALKMFFPDRDGMPGDWIDLAEGAKALVTYSPEYILRFRDGAPAQIEAKRKMWNSLKEMMARFPRG